MSQKLIKFTKTLKQKKIRDENELFLVEGVRLLEELLKSDWQIKYFLHTKVDVKDERWLKVYGDLKQKKIEGFLLKEEDFVKVSETKQSQGIIAVVKQKKEEMLPKISERVPLVLVLDNVRDPGNLGTVLRTAAAVNVTLVVLFGDCVDIYNSKVVRSTMGAIFQVPFLRLNNLKTLQEIFSKNKLEVFCTKVEKKSKEIWQVDFSKPVAVILGNESQGVSIEVENICNEKLYIPQDKKVESLNLASAATVILYESLRQKRGAFH